MVSYNVAIGPVFTFTRFVGLFPYKASGPLPRASRLISLTLNLIVISIGVATTSKDLYDKLWLKMDVFRFLRRLFGRLWFILGVLNHVYWQVRHPRKMGSILKRLEWLKINMESDFTWYNLPITVWGLLTYVVVLPAVVLCIRGQNVVDVIGGFMVPYSHNVLFLAQFFAFMEEIRCHFSKLNQLSTTARDLEKCSRIHAELCHLTREVNQVYSIELLLSFAAFLTSLITQMFQLFESLTQGEPHAAFLITLPWMFAFRIFQMWSLCYMCYEVHYESEVFANSLCYAMRMKYPPSYDRKLVLYVAMRPFATLNCFSLFDINTSILAAVLGTTVTYFIVLVQLK